MLSTGALSLGAFTDLPRQDLFFSSTSVSAATVQQARLHASQLEASDAFKQALIEEEGMRHTVYLDIAGNPTVGIGHRVVPADNLRVGQRISSRQVLELFEEDLAVAAQSVRLLVGDLPLHQHEFDALLDLVFNVGAGTVSERKSPRLNVAVDRGDYAKIARELDYRRAGGVLASGLQYRSERRANIFKEAVYDDPREA